MVDHQLRRWRIVVERAIDGISEMAAAAASKRTGWGLDLVTRQVGVTGERT